MEDAVGGGAGVGGGGFVCGDEFEWIKGRIRGDDKGGEEDMIWLAGF